MLGNHYFQLKNFILAEDTYERLLPAELANLKVKRKLIICYTQTNKLSKALQLLIDLIEQDSSTIIQFNSREEDCPCNDLIFQIESGIITYPLYQDSYLALGILWLYCNYRTSLNYFQMAIKENPNNDLLNKAFNLIKKLSKQNILQTN
ncbi:MAG TPA: hypothetical protein DHV28_06875 [Ignavibacteriales bacterium]|nr:hypothetical protein [Ignavibacteriales bacterium]